MGLPSHFLEIKFVKYEKDDDITPFDGSDHRGERLRETKRKVVAQLCC